MASSNGIVLTLAFVAIYCIYGNILLPKVFVDVNPIELITPQRNGFKIRLQKEFVDTYLDPRRMSTVFLAAIPLNLLYKDRRRMYHGRDNVQAERLLRIGDLESKAWYQVCVEFENVNRENNQGNTSRSCKIAVTLDDSGMSSNSMISSIGLPKIGSDEMRFQVAVDVDFVVEITAYLEKDTKPAQWFYLIQPSILNVTFGGLSPGCVYGKFCTTCRPLIQAYNPPVTQRKCHSASLQTKQEDGSSYEMPPSNNMDTCRDYTPAPETKHYQTRSPGGCRTAAGRLPSLSTVHTSLNEISFRVHTSPLS